jgi:hypothetical protein
MLHPAMGVKPINFKLDLWDGFLIGFYDACCNQENTGRLMVFKNKNCFFQAVFIFLPRNVFVFKHHLQGVLGSKLRGPFIQYWLIMKSWS